MTDATRNRDGVASGLSLWLMPPAAVRTELSALIQEFSRRCGTPAFEPHITLVGDIPPGADLVDKTRALGQQLEAYSVECGVAASGTSFFHAIFLPLVHDASIQHAHAVASEMFGLAPKDTYSPHVSIVYGNLNPVTKSEIVAELARAPSRSFRVAELRLQETIGQTEAWRPVVTVPFE